MSVVGSLDDLDHPRANFGERRPQLVACITAIGEDMAQPREAVTDAGEHIGRTVAILHISGVDHGPDKEALGVGDDMPLPAFDLLSCVIAPWPATFSGLDALAVDHPGAGTGLSPFADADRHQQIMVDGLPQAAVAPVVKVTLYRRRWWEVGR